MSTGTNTESSTQNQASKGIRIMSGIYKGISVAAKWSCFLLVALVLVASGQFGQLMSSSNDVRMAAIDDWRSMHPLQRDTVAKFVSDCIRGKPTSERSMETKLIGVYECGEAMGAADLVAYVRAADATIKTVAWPLSLVE